VISLWRLSGYNLVRISIFLMRASCLVCLIVSDLIIRREVEKISNGKVVPVALDTGEWLASRPGRFIPNKGHWHPSDRGWVGPSLDVVARRKNTDYIANNQQFPNTHVTSSLVLFSDAVSAANAHTFSYPQ
jgi:hypothetical protein